MAQYLMVAHQTAGSPAMVSKARQLAVEDPNAEFVLLVPATPIPHLLTWVEGESREVAHPDVGRRRVTRGGAALRRSRQKADGRDGNSR